MKKFDQLNQQEARVKGKKRNTVFVSPKILLFVALFCVLLIGAAIFVFRDSPDNRPTAQDVQAANSYTHNSVETIQYQDPTEFTNIPDATVLMHDEGMTVLGSNYQRTDIRKIFFVMSPTDIPYSAWDVSASRNGTIMAWVEKNGIYYYLYIASKNRITADKDCSHLFSDYQNMTSVDFANMLDTGEVETMESMFQNCEKLSSLDLSSFNTRMVKNTAYMFAGCKALRTLDISSFSLKLVDNTDNMSLNCPAVTIKYIQGLLDEAPSVSSRPDSSEDVPVSGNLEPTEEDNQKSDMATNTPLFDVGDIVTFGRYPQSADSNELSPIEWIILDQDARRILILSKYALDILKYNDSYKSVTWSNSTVRGWLNNDFLHAAFDENSIPAILDSTIDNSANHGIRGYGNGGLNTTDKVFLLSYKEAYTAYPLMDQFRICELTPYAKGKTDGNEADHAQWWLRSPGKHSYQALYILSDGTYKGVSVNKEYAVRPAMWIDKTTADKYLRRQNTP